MSASLPSRVDRAQREQDHRELLCGAWLLVLAVHLFGAAWLLWR